MAINFLEKIFKKKISPPEPVANFHTTIIRVENDFISSSSIILDDALEGNIFSLKEVKLVASAVVNGNISAESAIISGKVSGDITMLAHLEITKTAVIVGNVQSTSISIEAGAQINGSISILESVDDCELNNKLAKRILPKAERQEPEVTNIQPPVLTKPAAESVPKEVHSGRVPESFL